MNTNQVVKIRFRGPKFQTNGKALSDFTSIRTQDVKTNHFFLWWKTNRFNICQTQMMFIIKLRLAI